MEYGILFMHYLFTYIYINLIKIKSFEILSKE